MGSSFITQPNSQCRIPHIGKFLGFPSKIRNNAHYLLNYQTYYHIVSASAIDKVNMIMLICIEKKREEPSPIRDDIIIYVGNPKNHWDNCKELEESLIEQQIIKSICENQKLSYKYT